MPVIPENAKTTRTLALGEDFAVLRRTGRRSFVRRKGPRQLMPIWALLPWALVLPTGAWLIPKNVEAGFRGEKGRCASWNGGEVAEIERKTLDVPRACCVNGLYGLDFSSDIAGRAAGDVDCATSRVEDFDELKPDACVSAGNDADFAH